MEFLGVGPAEAIVVFVLILILVGPQRFPELMRQGGRYYRIARGYTTEVMKDVRAAVDELEQEVKEEAEDLQSIREIGDVGREIEQDLATTKRDIDSGDIDTATSARSATSDGQRARSPSPTPGASPGTAEVTPSSRPSSRARGSSETEPAPAEADAETAADAVTSEPGPSVADAAGAAANQSAPPKRTPAGPKPAPAAVSGQRISLPEDDPFKALEARRAAAQRPEDPETGDDGEKAGA